MKLRNKKTGEIVDLSEGFIKDTYSGEFIQLKPVSISNKEGYLYGSLSELNDEWEDYKPAEPLIKDEKIRKAVRAWAEANNIEDVAHYTFGDEFADFKAWDKFGKECEIMFYHRVELDEARHYTIAELCGEEEE